MGYGSVASLCVAIRQKGSGLRRVGDLGSHIIDLSRFLIGKVESVAATMATFFKERRVALEKGIMKKVDVDDAVVAIIRFKNGAIGICEASRFCAECKNYLAFEVNGFKRSLTFNLEQLNMLGIYRKDSNGRIRGPREVLVTESNQLFCSTWWPSGHILGWEHAHIHQLLHFLEAIVNDKNVEPYGATFEDGYKCAVICDAILASAANRTMVNINQQGFY